MRLHSFTRWFAIPMMRVVPFDTAASTVAVRNASVMVSISSSRSIIARQLASPLAKADWTKMIRLTLNSTPRRHALLAAARLRPRADAHDRRLPLRLQDLAPKAREHTRREAGVALKGARADGLHGALAAGDGGEGERVGRA